MLAPTAYALLDQARRQAGRALDAAGLGPVEMPSHILAARPGARLRAYQQFGDRTGPVLLIIPAPIKRAYIWDLLPEVSVVRHGLRRGLRVYQLEWLDPSPAEDGLGLADYAERLPLAMLEAVMAETGEAAAVLAGHSLGGTFAAILAALHPESVRGLVLVDAPLAFGPDRGGPLARAVAAAPHARVLQNLAGSPVPGSFTALLSTAAAPEAFVLQRWADLGASLPDPLAAAIHARVEHWILDEFAMPGQLFEEVLERLYREDRLVAGTLEVGGRRVGLDQLQSPVLAVVNPAGRVPRLSVVTTDIASGERVVFDMRRGGAPVGPEHLLASNALLPDFAPVEIGGRLLGDGGLSANAPLDLVLDEPTDGDLICFVLDLFAREGGRPQSLAEAAARALDLIFSSQSGLLLEGRRREHQLRAMLGRLSGRLPPELREDPEVTAVLAEGRTRPVTVLHLAYRAPAGEVTFQKTFDFSRPALTERWEVGARDMQAALRVLASLPGAADPAGLMVYKIRG